MAGHGRRLIVILLTTVVLWFVFWCNAGMTVCASEDYLSQSGSCATKNSNLIFESNKVTAEAWMEAADMVSVTLEVAYVYFDGTSGRHLSDTDRIITEGRNGYVNAVFEKDNCFVTEVNMDTVIYSEEGFKLLEEKLSTKEEVNFEIPEDVKATPTPFDVTPTPKGMMYESFVYETNKVQEETVVTITGYVGEETVVRIPETINGYEVVTISGGAFRNCSTISEIAFPETLQFISNEAFYGCKGLSEIVIPASTRVGSGAFAACDGLVSIVVEEGNEYHSVEGKCLLVHDSSRKEGVGLVAVATDFVIPDYVKWIGGGVFKGNSSLTEIELSDNIEYIEGSVFAECKNLCRVVMPKNIKIIEPSVFSDCENLRECIFPEDVVLEKLKGGIFSRCKNLERVELPFGMTVIKAACFYGCERLEYIKIPEGTTEIEGMAFARCYSLKRIDIPESVTEISDGAVFHECKNVTIYGIEGSVAHKYAIDNGIAFESIE